MSCDHTGKQQHEQQLDSTEADSNLRESSEQELHLGRSAELLVGIGRWHERSEHELPPGQESKKLFRTKRSGTGSDGALQLMSDKLYGLLDHFVRDGSSSESTQPEGAVTGLQRAASPCGNPTKKPVHCEGSDWG